MKFALWVRGRINNTNDDSISSEQTQPVQTNVPTVNLSRWLGGSEQMQEQPASSGMTDNEKNYWRNQIFKADELLALLDEKEQFDNKLKGLTS
jgi:hypothetical protein